MGHGILLADVAGARTDDEGDLHLPVHVVGAHGIHDVVVGADDAVGRLAEQDRLLGDLLLGLLGVIGEVEPDRDEVARAGNWRSEPRARRRQRQRLGIETAQVIERGG